VSRYIATFAVLLIGVALAASSPEYPSPGSIQKLRGLMLTDARVQRLAAPVILAADAARNRPPQPLEVIHYEGLLDTDGRRIQTVASLTDMRHLDATLQAWLATGKPEYAQSALRYVTAWTAAYQPTGNPINEVKLEPVLFGYHLLKAQFAAPERERIEAWVDQLAAAEVESARRNPNSRNSNWHTKRLLVVAWAAVILKNADFRDWTLAEAREYIHRSLRSDGSSYDFEHRDSLGYHMGGVKPLLALASLLETSGAGLYNYVSPSGASIRKSVEFVVPYATGERSHGEFLNSKVALDRKRAAAGLARYQPGTPFQPEASRELFAMASAFHPPYARLVARLVGEPEEQYPDWVTVLALSGCVREEVLSQESRQGTNRSSEKK
jgi:hypothetical protein